MDNNSVASTAPVYTLSIAAGQSGIPVHSIRQYIDKGLIIPFKKDSSRNLFSQVDILRLKYIHKLLWDIWSFGRIADLRSPVGCLLFGMWNSVGSF